MKYGLVVFKETENIGDDIQSYVAIKYLPKIDYYIEREKLDLFVPKKKEQVITIMNGWYLHSKINFPMSPYIYPIYVSVHFSNYDNAGITNEYLNAYSKKELDKYGPIGCRDTNTMELLSNANIDNYFTGCLTTTIKKKNTIKKTNKICIVDIDEKAEKYLRDNIGDPNRIIKATHTLDKNKNSKLSWETRFKNVEKLLDIYQSAELVITSRLHCALPCLALGTNVLLLYDENKAYTKDRLSDYSKIITHMSTEEFINSGMQIIENGITNPKNYLEIRHNINKIVKQKLSEAEKRLNTNLPSIDDYKKFYITPKINTDYIFNICQTNYNNLKRDYIELEYAVEYWKREFNRLLEISNINDMERIKEENNMLLQKYEEVIKENNYLKKEIEKKQKRKYKWK